MAFVVKVQGRVTDWEAVWGWLANLTVLNKITNVRTGLRKAVRIPQICLSWFLTQLLLEVQDPGYTVK